MAINIPLSTLCINGKIDQKVIKLILDKIEKMGYIDCSFDPKKMIFIAGYKMKFGDVPFANSFEIYHTNLIGISDKYVYINPCNNQEELISYLKSIRSIIREESLNIIGI